MTEKPTYEDLERRVKALEKKLAEKSRDNDNGHFQRILDCFSSVIYTKDLQGRYTAINRQFEKLSGLKSMDVLGKTDFELFPNSVAENSTKNDKQVIRTGIAIEVEELGPVDGHMHSFLSSKYPLVNQEDKIYGTCGISIDITSKRQLEKKLFESRNMLQTVLDSIPSAVFWKDKDFKYLGGNLIWLDAAGKKRIEDVVGKTDYDLPWKKEQADSFREDDKRVMESGIPEHGIIEPYQRKEGTQGWAKTNKIPLRDTTGNIIGVLGTYEDITEQKRMEIALRESEAQKKAILDSSIDSMMLVDKNMRIIWTNKIIEKQLGVKRDEIVGKFCYEVYTGRDKPCPDCPTLKTQKSGKTEHSIICEENVKGIPGKTYWADYTVPLKDESGKIFKFLQVSRDITDLKKAEEEKEKVILELKHAMSKVKTLSGLLPICSLCKKIRDDRGYWNQIESYIHKHSDAEFSHSICPECANKHYPDMDIYDD